MKELEWFSISNYDGCANWTAREWFHAIETRNYFQWLSSEQGVSQLHYIIAHDVMGVPIAEVKTTIVTEEDRQNYWRERVDLLHSRGDQPSFNEAHYTNPENKRTYRAIRVVDIGYLGAVYNDVISKLNVSPEQEETIRGQRHFDDELLPMLRKSVDEVYAEAYKSPESWASQLLLTVDLDVPDPVLIQQFLEEIQARRKKHNIEALSQVPNEVKFAKWHRNKILGYFDICLFELTQGASFTDQQKGLALFPAEFDKSLDEKIRKTVRPLAASVFRPSTLTALQTTSSDWFR
jgi:hypothetical protein